MNRKHTKEDYIELISKIKNRVPKMAFSSDFIVGYPGETEQDFEETLDLIVQIGVASSYSFKYSPRPGTPASLDKNLIDELVLNKRLKKIQKVLLDQQNYFNNSFLEKEVEVLFTKKTNKTDQFVGRTKYLQPVHVFSKVNLIGKILRIKIEKLTSFSFHGRIISS